MNNPKDGVGTSQSESDPKLGRKKPRRPRKRGGKRQFAENAVGRDPVTNPSGDKNRFGATGPTMGQTGSDSNIARNKPRHAEVRDNSYYAALDLGTNNCRLLVATPQARGKFRVVDGFSRIVRLGEGLIQTGALSEPAMDRAVEALKICASKLRNRPIRRQRLIATEACRQASNGEAFLNRVQRETGMVLEIVSRETEAHLAASGCGALLDRQSDGAVLFDIGGGSSELILVNRSDPSIRKIRDQIVAWTSLPLGVVTLAERFGGRDISRQLFDEMVDDVSARIDQFDGKSRLDEIMVAGNVHLLGTSGTVTTLAGIHLRLAKYDRRKVDGLWLSSDEIDSIIDELLDMEYEERAANPCIGSERADLVLAGCAILNAIRKNWPSDRLRVADRGLREGLLTEMMYKDGAWSKKRKQRWSKKRRKRRASSAQGTQG